MMGTALATLALGGVGALVLVFICWVITRIEREMDS